VDDEDVRANDPISSLTLTGLGKGMWNRARTQGEGVARQIAQNYQDLGTFARDAVSPIFPREPSGYAPWEPRPAEMKEAPFAQPSSDPGVRFAAHALDPANFVGLGGGGLALKAVKQAATSRALRAAAEREALAKRSADWIASPPGFSPSRGY